MRKIAIILFATAVCTIVFCVGCANVDNALHHLARGQIVAMHQDYDEPRESIDIIETDSYGRILFRAKKQTIFYANKLVSAYVICQYEKNEIGYCYPDICYELTYADEEITDERINALKERNDWQMELDYEKCKAEPLIQCGDSLNNKMKDSFYSFTGNKEAYLRGFCFDTDVNGLELHAIVYSDNSGFTLNGKYELYLMVVCQSETVLIEKVEDPMTISSTIIKVKEKTAWKEVMS